MKSGEYRGIPYFISINPDPTTSSERKTHKKPVVFRHHIGFVPNVNVDFVSDLRGETLKSFCQTLKWFGLSSSIIVVS
jgi:hypothetical protein